MLHALGTIGDLIEIFKDLVILLLYSAKKVDLGFEQHKLNLFIRVGIYTQNWKMHGPAHTAAPSIHRDDNRRRVKHRSQWNTNAVTSLQL